MLARSPGSTEVKSIFDERFCNAKIVSRRTRTYFSHLNGSPRLDLAVECSSVGQLEHGRTRLLLLLLQGYPHLGLRLQFLGGST